MSYGLEVRMTRFELDLKAKPSRVTVYVDVQKDGREVEKYVHEETFNSDDKSETCFTIGKCMQFCLDQIT